MIKNKLQGVLSSQKSVIAGTYVSILKQTSKQTQTNINNKNTNKIKQKQTQTNKKITAASLLTAVMRRG